MFNEKHIESYIFSEQNIDFHTFGLSLPSPPGLGLGLCLSSGGAP